MNDTIILDWLSDHATFIMFINDNGSDEVMKIIKEIPLRELIADKIISVETEPVIIIGRKIIAQGNNWIKLDTGKKIYLDPTELERTIK